MSNRTITVYPRTNRSLAAVVAVLKAGKVVAGPSETAYGLFADAANASAVRAVARLKGRRDPKAMPLVASDMNMVRKYCRMNTVEAGLARRFWPGPLTLVLTANGKLLKAVRAADGTVGIRIPGSVWLRKLARGAGGPLVATSANVTGKSTPYSAAQVTRALVRRGLSYMVDGGKLRRRPTSTVVKVERARLTVLRDGAIPRRKLERMLRS